MGIILQGWTPIEYGQSIGSFGSGSNLKPGCQFWSNPVLGQGDSEARDFKIGFLNWLGKAMFWKKWLILKPEGSADTWLVVAFWDEDGNCMYSSCARRVWDGPFMVRMGPKDCKFFVVGSRPVTLEQSPYFKKGMDLY